MASFQIKMKNLNRKLRNSFLEGTDSKMVFKAMQFKALSEE